MSHDQLVEDLAALRCRPYDFVFWAFPWGEVGELYDRKGPEDWQGAVLFELQQEMLKGQMNPFSALSEAYKIAIRSGHDIGKTAFLGWLFWWAFSTREDTRGRATANTERQLRQILQPEISKWHRLFIARDMFKVDATAIRSADPERRDTWRFDLIPWSEDNPEAFAGLHNFHKRIIVMFDEASGISDKIWEVTDGVMHEAETEIIWVCTGNPTKNTGRFKECWSKFKDSWHTSIVDSRSVSFTNKVEIEKSIAQWGIDSDYVKVRYLGEFPDTASTQLIPVDLITAARSRAPSSAFVEPLILSLDVARFGTNESVLSARRGKDARSIPVQRWRGLSTVESGNRLALAINQLEPDATFIDEGGVGGGVVDFVRSLGHSVIGVNYGSKPSLRPQGVLVANKRAEMYVSLLQWLREGGCIEDSEELEKQLVAIEYYFSKKQEIQLVPKEDMEKEGFPSPDWADSLAQTFAFPVSLRPRVRRGTMISSDWNPYSDAAVNSNERVPVLPVTWEPGEPKWA